MLIIIGTAIYIGINLVVAKMYSAKEMKGSFITGQCVAGRIFTNIFYAPAWVLKLLRAVVLAAVK